MTVLGMYFNLPTLVVLAILVVLSYFAAHRVWSRGMCDCHADNPRGGGCSGGCAGCSGCGAASKMAADMEKAAKKSCCH